MGDFDSSALGYNICSICYETSYIFATSESMNLVDYEKNIT